MTPDPFENPMRSVLLLETPTASDRWFCPRLGIPLKRSLKALMHCRTWKSKKTHVIHLSWQVYKLLNKCCFSTHELPGHFSDLLGTSFESKALIRIAFFPFLYSSWPLSDCDNLLDEPFEPTDPPPLVPHGLPPPSPELLE